MLQIISVILAALSAILIAKVQAIITENSKLKEELNTEKHEVYTELLNFLRSLLDNRFKGDLVAKTQELNEKIILLASAKVLKAFGDLMQNIYMNPKIKDEKRRERKGFQTLRLYGELVIAVREDLGIDKKYTRVSWADILRPGTNDMNEYLPIGYVHHRNRRTLPWVNYRKHEKLVKVNQQ